MNKMSETTAAEKEWEEWKTRKTKRRLCLSNLFVSKLNRLLVRLVYYSKCKRLVFAVNDFFPEAKTGLAENIPHYSPHSFASRHDGPVFKIARIIKFIFPEH